RRAAAARAACQRRAPATPRTVHPVRRPPRRCHSGASHALLILGVAAALAGMACQRGAESGVGTRRIRSADLRPLVLGQTTDGDVQRRFGVPDERAEDGALTYHTTIASGRSERITFRFTNGVLARICRSRS